MKLKTIEQDGKTYAEVSDGKPVYVNNEGQEVGFDAVGMHEKITQLNGESMGRRKELQAAQEKLKAYGDLDAEAAIKALETVKNLDDKKLVDAGDVEKVKQEVAKGYEQKLLEAEQRAEQAEQKYNVSQISNAFSGSKYIKDNLAIPHDLAQSHFGGQFKIEDGKVTAKDASGNPIYSKSNMGSLAEFDEAIQIIVDSYQHRDSILKGTGSGGSGAEGGSGSGGRRKMSRSEFDGLPAQKQSSYMESVRKGEAILVD